MSWDKKTSYKALSIVVVLVAFSFIASGFELTGMPVANPSLNIISVSVICSGSTSPYRLNISAVTNIQATRCLYYGSVSDNLARARSGLARDMSVNPTSYFSGMTRSGNNYAKQGLLYTSLPYFAAVIACQDSTGRWVRYGYQPVHYSQICTQQPNLVLSSPTQDQVITNNSLVLRFAVSNSPTGSKINISLDNSRLVQITTGLTYSLSNLTNGSHSVSLELVDSQSRSLSPRVLVTTRFSVNLANISRPVLYTPVITSAVRSANRVSLSWTFSKPGSSYYYIYRNSVNSISSNVLNPTAVFSTSYNDTSVLATNRYYYWVKANGNLDETSLSRCVPGTGLNQSC